MCMAYECELVGYVLLAITLAGVAIFSGAVCAGILTFKRWGKK